MVAGDSDATQSMADLLIMLYNKLESHEIEVQNMRCELTASTERLAAVETDLRYMNEENQSLRYKLAATEDATRSMYLRLEGLNENLNNNLPKNVATNLSKTGVVCTVADIDYVRRLGKQKHGEPRPVLIRFNKEGKRNSLLHNRTNINKNKKANDPFLWLNDDVSEETRRNRKAVRDIATLANQLGTATVKVHGDGLILDNKFKHEDLDLLPPELSIASAKSRVEATGIYFQGPSSPYSNMHPARFSDDKGQAYESVEQAYQHKKALAHDKALVANKILATRDPMKIKKLSKQVPTSKAWLKNENQVMEDLLRCKFTQNESLAHALVKTEGLELHEATSDRKWGTGAELSSKSLLNGLWEGQDLLGQMIEKIRGELITAGFIGPEDTDNASLVESQAEADTEDDLSPIPENEYDNENGDKSESENEEENETVNGNENENESGKDSSKQMKARKGSTSHQSSGNTRGNQGIKPPDQRGKASMPTAGRAKKQTPDLSLSQSKRTTSTSSTAASEASATSPVSTHSLIHSLTRRKNKRAAPNPPGLTAGTSQANPLPPRGNRVSTRASQKTAPQKGKN